MPPNRNLQSGGLRPSVIGTDKPKAGMAYTSSSLSSLNVPSMPMPDIGPAWQVASKWHVDSQEEMAELFSAILASYEKLSEDDINIDDIDLDDLGLSLN